MLSQRRRSDRLSMECTAGTCEKAGIYHGVFQAEFGNMHATR